MASSLPGPFARQGSSQTGLFTRESTLEALCIDGYPARGAKPTEESADGIPILKVRNVTGRSVDMETEYAPDSDETRFQCGRALVRKDDILITSTGEGTIGRVDRYAYDESAIADGHVTIVRLRPNINVEYVIEFLRSEYGQIQMLRFVSGSTGQTELLVEYVKNLILPIPTPILQEEIVSEMVEARTRAKQLQDEAGAFQQESATVLAVARRNMVDRLAKPDKGDSR